MLSRVNEWITNALLVIAATLAFLLSFLVVADVTGRVLFNSPVKGTPEIVSISIVIICYLQAAYAIRSGGMLRVDAVVTLLPAPVRGALDVAGALLGAAFFGLIVWGAYDPAVYSWTSDEFEGEGALRVPVWPARFIMILGAALAILNYLLLAYQSLLRMLGRGAPPPPPPEQLL
jgi:TRAP-type C4-dicarboxylate transport system permease small subunit